MSFKAFFEAAKNDAESALSHIEGLIEADAHKALVDLHAALYGTLDRIEVELKKVPNLPGSIYDDLASKIDAILYDVEELITGAHPAPDEPEVPAAPVPPAAAAPATPAEPAAQTVAEVDHAAGTPSSWEPQPADPVAIPGVTDTPVESVPVG